MALEFVLALRGARWRSLCGVRGHLTDAQRAGRAGMAGEPDSADAAAGVAGEFAEDTAAGFDCPALNSAQIVGRPIVAAAGFQSALRRVRRLAAVATPD